jgi:hypothetical protein
LTGIPPLIDFDPSVSLRHSTLDEIIVDLTKRFSVLWKWTSDSPCLIGKTYSLQEQQEFELKSETLLGVIEPPCHTRNGAQKQIERLRDCVRGLIVETVDENMREHVNELLTAFSESGDDFVRRSQEFDEDLRPDGIVQALRNVWIVNSMQAAYGIPICANPSGFGYSLLYTYTDSYLDSGIPPLQEKEEFGNVFGLRLAGIDIPEITPLISKVSSLVRLIESEYPRDLFPQVYASLHAIHQAQLMSLQQRTRDSLRGTPDVLHISVKKGGTSVVADAYLAKGRLTMSELEFAFGYGVVLQFIDDLQDVIEDLVEGSETVFTRASRKGTLDSITYRLMRCLQKVLEYTRPSQAPRADGLTDLIFQGSMGLVFEPIALNPGMFSAQFSKGVERYSPLRFESIRRMYEKSVSFEPRLATHTNNCTTLISQ